jgi:diguanylate cyclase (GGDEF)-like protein/putative nucleotidyltransferase with HDIG domain
MGLLPLGDVDEAGRIGGLNGTPAEGLHTETTAIVRAQALFLFCGAIVGIFGVLLPHPDTFLTTALIVLNSVCWFTAIGAWILAPKVPASWVRWMPAAGTLLITASVILSRDPTSAYALLYLFPCVYVYYFLTRIDAAFHIAFAAVNYLFAVLYISQMPGAPDVANGSVLHHFVITIGSLVVVGAMLAYLRHRVEKLMAEVVASARTDLHTGLLNSRGLTETLGAEIERARMGAHRVSLLVVEVSGLIAQRGRSGDRAADAATVEIAGLLGDSTRRIDTVARTGAADFAIVLPETDENTAFLLAEQVLGRLRRAYREWGSQLSTSIGIAAFPKHAASAEVLRKSAVSACQAAKTLGGDRAVVFSVELEDVLQGDPSRGLSERRTHLSTVLSLAEVLDLRDARTAAHSLNVSRYCELIAEELGLPAQRVQRLRLAGLLHDIGKVGIPDSILEKPGPLSPGEWDQVRRHPEMAARILGARELTDIREWVLARHEQPDGHGYPRGLAGEEIPLEARILAVAETYDALTSERPYRSARSGEEAIAEIGRYAGSQFDGGVVDALVRVLGDDDLAERLGAPESGFG